jgi:hypothetical protein
MEACKGSVNSTQATDSAVACSANYRGERCAECSAGTYRLKGACHRCVVNNVALLGGSAGTVLPPNVQSSLFAQHVMTSPVIILPV